MNFIRTRTIHIDVIPHNPDPFITMYLEKVICDESGAEIQVIGSFGRIVKRLSNIEGVAVGAIADDGIVSASELFNLIAIHTSRWIIEVHGGTPRVGGGVDIES